MRARLVFAAAASLAGSAAAADVHIAGYADLRFVVPSTEDSYYRGDLSKLRYGYRDERVTAKLSDIVGEARILVTPEWTVTATGRISGDYGPAIDITEGFVRYRPVSTTAWRWSLKLGAFFPPVSLENDQIGWTSAWTITPSAINSWVGYELRTIGGEGTMEWRFDNGSVALSGAVFGWNDPAGVLLADRGWSLDDRASGLLGRERIPDAIGYAFHATGPSYTRLFSEIDGRPGWYLNLSWQAAGIGSFELMRYDNNADPSVKRDSIFAWHTSFWNAGYKKEFDNVTLMAQAMTGSTEIRPAPSRRAATNFAAAYLLTGIDLDPWRLAARLDVFRTHTIAASSSLQNEDGVAGTFAATYWARSWLQLTGELIVVDSTRPQRTLEGDPPHITEREFQLLARGFF